MKLVCWCSFEIIFDIDPHADTMAAINTMRDHTKICKGRGEEK